jgi:hypothetical protein
MSSPVAADCRISHNRLDGTVKSKGRAKTVDGDFRSNLG